MDDAQLFGTVRSEKCREFSSVEVITVVEIAGVFRLGARFSSQALLCELTASAKDTSRRSGCQWRARQIRLKPSGAVKGW
jgi:hypothetical protein